jgi:two-component system cell cycle response regulator
VPWYAPDLADLLAVAAAEFDDRGTLLEANAGFVWLAKAAGRQGIGANSAELFINPSFATLRRLPDGQEFSGLLTVGAYDGQTFSLRGRVWRAGERLRLLAEHDIAGLLRLSATTLEVNAGYAAEHVALSDENFYLHARGAEILADALVDPLTAAANRRGLDQALAAEIARAIRTTGKLGVVMADLDYFKAINDTYGHGAGDIVLRAFADIMRGEIRATDVVARYGGEEFILLMPDTALQSAADIAERIRGRLAATLIDPLAWPLTASFGVVELAPNESGEAVLKRVDSALYEAKNTGRNRVVVCQTDTL